MDERIKKIMSSVLGVDVSVINDDCSPETIEEWDSLKHLNIVLALEEEFGIQFTPDEILDLISYKLIRLIINSKTNE